MTRRRGQRDQLWEQYRRRMPQLASCRAEDLDALRQLRRAGWRTGIVTNGMTDSSSLGASAPAPATADG
jgi:hypothetical protein